MVRVLAFIKQPGQLSDYSTRSHHIISCIKSSWVVMFLCLRHHCGGIWLQPMDGRQPGRMLLLLTSPLLLSHLRISLSSRWLQSLRRSTLSWKLCRSRPTLRFIQPEASPPFSSHVLSYPLLTEIAHPPVLSSICLLSHWYCCSSLSSCHRFLQLPSPLTYCHLILPTLYIL